MAESKNLWEVYSDQQLQELEVLCKEYRHFLDNGKTERECVTEAVKQATAKGYQKLEDVTSVKPGDKIYATWMDKAIVLFQIGSDPLTKGMNILGAHVDSPRMDLKQNPIYEDSGFAYFDTHYYGGIKKYQWTAIPLAIHGVVVKKDGTKLNISIGEAEDDPVFTISELLIHLSAKHLEKKASVVIEGEGLDVLIGSKPLKDTDKDAVTAQIVEILKNSYGFEKEDLMSAELEVVPAGKARDCGLDRSMILGYGHDDRICAYTSMKALFDTPVSNRTYCCILVDKEEVGSMGATGMQSRFFENVIGEILEKQGGFSELDLRRTLAIPTYENNCVN